MKKLRTPEELANRSKLKDKYTLYLTVERMEYIKERSGKAGTSASEVVDEAIRLYIDSIKKKKNS
jgi:hypothetical protein